ncbi:hypothetical protein PFISCL1PPCAC_26991 [Pristionchus fissidentatus]|uniref:Fungal lipase-type domain-containing protein n=1 Tax=Pristionchus fissidentatus TaxID=1538716 RepID=A0AAV5X1N4_9BILA|nr:hypothetical protein PFISCL1PPCAC_26991 [Pristionchus fissidentatus]
MLQICTLFSFGILVAGQVQTGYNEDLARSLLNLASAAYGTRQDECILRTFPPEQQYYVYNAVTTVCDEIDSSCEFYIVNSNVTRKAFIVFRGTKTTGQLLLEGWQSYQPGIDFIGMGAVNKYFNRAHDHLWPSVLDYLARPEFQGYAITFTGHSLGGALASLAAARTVSQRYRPASSILLYTFGQPRTGSYKYAMTFDALGIKSYRVVFSDDIIPHNPSCKKNKTATPLENGSRPCLADESDQAYHHGIEIWYPQSMTPGSPYIQCVGQPTNEDMNCSDLIMFNPDDSDVYAWKHRNYFNTYVTNFGKSGCTNTTMLEEPPYHTGERTLGSAIKSVLEAVNGRK